MSTYRPSRTNIMLEALCKSFGLLHWINSFVRAEKDNGEQYYILYSGPWNEKVCKVWKQDIAKLPSYVRDNPNQSKTHIGKAAPNKAQAAADEKLVEVPAFYIACHLGKETNLGRERRFSDLVYAPTLHQQPPQDETPW